MWHTLSGATPLVPALFGPACHDTGRAARNYERKIKGLENNLAKLAQSVEIQLVAKDEEVKRVMKGIHTMRAEVALLTTAFRTATASVSFHRVGSSLCT